MLGVLAEFETNLRRERQLEGIAKAMAAGVYKARQTSMDATRVRAMKAEGMGGDRTATAIAARTIGDRVEVIAPHGSMISSTLSSGPLPRLWANCRSTETDLLPKIGPCRGRSFRLWKLDVPYWPCAPKARITYGRRIHPESCRLIW